MLWSSSSGRTTSFLVQTPLVYSTLGERLMAARPERELATKQLGQIIQFQSTPDRLYALESSRVLRRSLEAARAFQGDAVAEMVLGGETRSLPPFHIAPPTADAVGHVEAMPHYAGESCGAIAGVEPAADLVRRLLAETETLLRRHG